MQDYKTEIIKVKGDWREVVDDCRSTVGKAGLGKDPSQDFKKRILIKGLALLVSFHRRILVKNKKKINNKSIVTMAIIICSIMGLISLYKIINWYSDTKEVCEIKENLSKYVKPKDTTYEIDFKKLKEQNNSVVAYLKVNDTNIDYVVVQGNDNDYYLHHDFNKNPNIARPIQQAANKHS